MDDIEDQKRRLLTPPTEWLERVKTKSPDQRPDFEPPFDDNDGVNTLSTKSVTKDRGKNPKAARLTAIVSSILLIGMTSLWLETRSNGKARIVALETKLQLLEQASNEISIQKNKEINQNEARSIAQTRIVTLEEKVALLEQAANEDSLQKNELTAENETLRSQVSLLETSLRSVSNENTSLKKNQDRRQEDPTPIIKAAKVPTSSETSLISPPSQAGGIWFVNLESHTSSVVAEDRAAELRVQLEPLNISVAGAVVRNRQYFRVRAAGFKSEALAKRAADWMSLQAKAGPYWIGKNRDETQDSGSSLKTTASKSEVTISKPDTPLNLQELRDPGSWFIFVDRFEQRSLAEAAIKDLSDQGLEAKVTVEAKSGDIFYRVQISGIENEAKGDAIMKQLRRSQFTDAKLRKTVG